MLKQFDYCDVGFSLMTLDDRLAQQAVSPTRRLQALASLQEQGICTYAFISPYLSRLSDINRLVEALSGSIDEIGVEAINTRGENWQGVEKVLARHYPALLKDCKRLSKDDDYWMELETQVHLLADQYQIKLLGFFRY